MRTQTVHIRAARLISILLGLGMAFCLPITHAPRAQAISPASSAQVIKVTTSPAGDTVQWAQFNIAPQTTFCNSASIRKLRRCRGSIDQRGSATIEEQCCAGHDGLFDGNFASGDLLIQTPNGARQLTLSSNQPVKSVGTQIAANAFSTFIAQIQAFHHNQLFDTFTLNARPAPRGPTSASGP